MARLRAWLSTLVLASCALSYDAAAQQRGVSRLGLDSLRAVEGLRVRLKDVAFPDWRTGTLGPVNDRTLILRGKHDVSIPTANLVAAQLSTGRRRWDGAVLGFPIGVVVGGVIGYAIGNSASSRREPHGSQRSVGLVVGAASGGGIGALIGAALAPERWRDIRLR